MRTLWDIVSQKQSKTHRVYEDNEKQSIVSPILAEVSVVWHKRMIYWILSTDTPRCGVSVAEKAWVYNVVRNEWIKIFASPDGPYCSPEPSGYSYYPCFFSIPSRKNQYTLNTRRVHPQAMEDIPKNRLCIALGGVSKRSADVPPRPSSQKKHSGLMATHFHKKTHSPRSAAIVSPNDAKCRHYRTERQCVMMHWRHFGTLIR